LSTDIAGIVDEMELIHLIVISASSNIGGQYLKL
jgi:hypothetical protein